MTLLQTAVARVSAFLFFATTSWSIEPFKPDVTGEINTDWVADLDHLEPYQDKVHLPEYYYLAQFFEAPAMADKANYLVILRTKDRRYLMRLSQIPADKFPGEAPKPDTEIEVPESLASVVYDLWVNALLEVRYERKQHGGFDGETYVFSTFVASLGWMHGTTWSPSGDLPPTWMMNAGKKLVAFARDQKRDPKATEIELTILRDKLFQYLSKHGKH